MLMHTSLYGEGVLTCIGTCMYSLTVTLVRQISEIYRITHTHQSIVLYELRTSLCSCNMLYW